MFGCCTRPQFVFRKDANSPPDLDKLKVIYADPSKGGLVSAEERDFETPRPHKCWVALFSNGEAEKICSCPCHNAVGLGFLC